MGYKFNKGDLVQINSTGEIASILDIYDKFNRVSYIVFSNNKKSRFKEEDLSVYIDSDEKLNENFQDGNFLGADAFREYVYYIKFSYMQENNLYSYLGNKIIFNPFQYKPLLKFISFESDERLLIADEVGVGKTIESGIILDELRARGELNEKTPILIICPNILCYKWREELATKFSLHGFHIHDGTSLMYMFDRIISGYKNPYMFSICSEQLIRGERYHNYLKICYEKIGKEIFDFLIIDECHHYRNPSTNTHKLGKLLSECSKRVLMLSATPFNLRNDDLYNQLHLLNPMLFSDRFMFEQLIKQISSINNIIRMIKLEGIEHFRRVKIILNDFKIYLERNSIVNLKLNDIIHRFDSTIPLSFAEINEMESYLHSLNPIGSSFTRTMKREAIEHRVTRDTKSFIVILNNEEFKIYKKFIEINLKRYKILGISERAFGLITNGLERIAASSIPALKNNLQRILDKSNDVIENELIEEQGFNDILAKALAEDMKKNYEELWNKIIELKGTDSKYDTLKHLIEDIWSVNDNKRIIIFSFYVGTLKYLKNKLMSDGYKVGLIYGGTPKDTYLNNISDNKLSRHQIMNKFKKGEFDILLASEVGGEGLDFQFCSAIVNYDLPYNPMRIEQRIGRIDRMGQIADKIIIGNLCIKNTVDEVIKEVLLSRISSAEDLIGEMEPIITRQFEEINKSIISNLFTEKELHKRARELEERIEKEKQVRQDFDEQRYELVNDTNFREEFTNKVIDSRINPQEALLMTKSFIKNELGSTLKIVSPTSARMKITSSLKNNIALYMRNNNLVSPRGELQQIISSSEICTFDFDGNSSYYNQDVIFLKPSGEWIHFILSSIKERMKENISPLFHIKINFSEAMHIEVGQYWIYLYEVITNGYKESKYMHYVFIDANIKQVVPIEEKQWGNFLMSVSNSNLTLNLNYDEVIETRDVADIEVEEYLDQLRKEFITKNDAKFSSRIQALKYVSNRKTEELSKNINLLSDKSKKTIEKNIKRVQEKIRQKIAILEDKRKFSISYSPMALCILDVV